MSKSVYEDLSDIMTEFITLNHSTVSAAQQFEKRMVAPWNHVSDEHRLDLLETLGDKVANDMAEVEEVIVTLREAFVLLSTITVKATLDLNTILNSFALARAKQAESN